MNSKLCKSSIPVCKKYITPISLSIIGIAIVLISSPAAAQVVENNILGDTITTYEDRMQTIFGSISGLLINTFYLLALLEFSWGMLKNYIDNGGLQGFLSELITRIMFIGFFLFLFEQGTEIPRDIVDTFKQLANEVPDTPVELTPDNVLDIGQNFVAQAWNEIESTNILAGLGLLFASLIVFASMVILAAHLTVALLEFFVVGYAGFILLAFGASRWTHGYATAYLKYAMSVGMKLFVLLIIVAVIQVEMAAYLAAVDQASITNVWAVCAFALFSTILAVIAPQSVMGMMSGVSIASGAGAVAAGVGLAAPALGVAAVASRGVNAAASVTTGAMGAAQAVGAAGRLGGAAGSASGRSGAGAIASGTGAVAKETASAAAAAGSTVLSKVFPVGQSVGGKLAARMNTARDKLSSSQD